MNENNMKMYYFSKGGYCEEYHIMAKSKRDALLYLQRHCSENEIKLSDSMKNYYNAQYEFFKQNPEYIYEYDEGQVIQTEVS